MGQRSLQLECLIVGSMVCVVGGPARADVRLAGIFGDHMVLQREDRVHLWGHAAPGELIRVRPSWYEHDAAVTASPEGVFDVALTTPEASGPHTIHFTGRNEVTLSDVMIGEVWLASGQSNMEMGVGYLHPSYSGVKDWEKELTDAARPRIRFFAVENVAAPAPLREVRGSWRVADAASVKEFSATAWFFAKKLEQELEVPIGVVTADWGGTPAEAWTSAKALASFPQYAPALEQCANLADASSAAETSRRMALERWEYGVSTKDPLSAAHAEKPGFDDSRWSKLDAPGNWSGDLASFDGIVWMRRQVELPASWAGRDLELSLGAIDDDDRTWFNGEPAGATRGWDAPRRYEIGGARVQKGLATIAVRVLDTGGEGGFHGDAALMQVSLAGGGESISLAGSWKTARGAALSQLPALQADYKVGGHMPTALFNGMIAPLGGWVFAGVIWYQGEANVGRAEEYAALFPAMIEDWRAHFRRELPFLFVQIAPYGYAGDSGQAAELREAQRAALTLTGTGMVLTTDIGDPADVHPKNKQTVGLRLAELALDPEHHTHYPEAQSAQVDGSTVQLEFKEPLEVCGVSTFELASSEGPFLPASQTLGPETGQVLVQCPEIQEPARIRYAWGAAAGASLRSTETGLPVGQFSLTLR
ncbi:MAG TPA: sialate O-acetylesterase [Planctomycetota bacterium]|nr:sialate O-acetylesterase [Planctomycetota bacterium]